MIDVAVKAGENISKSLQDVRVVLTKLADQALTGADRTNYENQYNTLKNDIDNFIKDAKYNNITLINTGTNQSIISNIDGGNITVTAPGKIDVKTGNKQFAGPDRMPYAFPQFTVCKQCVLDAQDGVQSITDKA